MSKPTAAENRQFVRDLLAERQPEVAAALRQATEHQPEPEPAEEAG
jgi:hypothetical protein